MAISKKSHMNFCLKLSLMVIMIVSFAAFVSCGKTKSAVLNDVQEDASELHDEGAVSQDTADTSSDAALADEYKRLFWEAYDNKDYTTAEDYCAKAAELGDADCESWMGRWAENDLRYREAMDWYMRSVSHGNARAMYSIAEMYCKAGDYETAREWYEKEVAAGDELDDALLRLNEIPSSSDNYYFDLFNYALYSSEVYNGLRNPSFISAFAYALKGNILNSGSTDIVPYSLGIYIPADLMQEYLETGNGDKIMMELAELSFNDIQSIASSRNAEDYFFLCKNIFGCYREYADKGNPAAKYLMERLAEDGIELP